MRKEIKYKMYKASVYHDECPIKTCQTNFGDKRDESIKKTSWQSKCR